MEKIMEKQMGDRYYKYYNDDLAPNPLNIINQMVDSNIAITSIHLEEDAEMDMKVYMGNYDLNYVLENFTKMQNFTAPFLVNVYANKDNKEFIINMKSGSNIVYLESPYPDLELNEILGKSRPVG